MPKIRVIDKDVEVESKPGEPVLFAMWDNGVNMTSVCGGNCSCGTCNFEIVEGAENLNAKLEDEERVLSRIKRQGPNVRLGCQAVPTGPITIRIVPEDL